ncbi:helix-turn-helix domain-containing protein [Levilactobacillus tujiorum]|uniref:helix-turn-helix domain-containing protein n=1 Tax=Levilactobacillus tujiorum TaxID=2912243 RepID=UPI001F0F2EDC|nr:helix-turn-helix domain-containing protein [Levilactobacillus tujiorum]
MEAFLKDGQSIRQTARDLHWNPSTISREVKRGTIRQLNSEYLPYYRCFAESGQIIYEKHRLNCHSKGLLKRCWLFANLLESTLGPIVWTALSIAFNVSTQTTHFSQYRQFIATLI